MRFFIKFTGLLLILLSCSTSINGNKASIEGKILNYSKYKNVYKTIDFIVFDLLSSQEQTYFAEIDHSGKFQIQFPMMTAFDVHMKFGKKKLSIYCEPGTTLYMEFDAEEMTKLKDTSPCSSLVFKGDLKQINENISDFIPLYNSLTDERNEIQRKKMQELDPSSFKTFRQDWLKAEQALLQGYIKQYATSEEFNSWAKNQINFGYVSDLLYYELQRSRALYFGMPLDAVSDEYFDLDKFDLNDASAMNSSYFQHALAHFDYYYQSKKSANIFKEILKTFISETPDLSKSDKQKLEKILKKDSIHLTSEENRFLVGISRDYEMFFQKENKRIIMNNIVNNVKKEFSGNLKEVLLSRALYRELLLKNLDIVKPYYQDYLAETQTAYYKTKIEELYNNIEKYITQTEIPKDAKLFEMADVSGDSLWNKIIKDNKGKVVYITLWSTWSEKSRQEVPFSVQLSKEFNSDKVAFVYLCARSLDNIWKASIDQYDISGTHYLISLDQYRYLNDRFQIRRLPYFILIKKDGTIESKRAISPSTQGKVLNKSLVKTIKDLL